MHNKKVQMEDVKNFGLEMDLNPMLNQNRPGRRFIVLVEFLSRKKSVECSFTNWRHIQDGLKSAAHDACQPVH